MTSIVTTEPRVWLLYAQFNEAAYPKGEERRVSEWEGGSLSQALVRLLYVCMCHAG